MKQKQTRSRLAIFLLITTIFLVMIIFITIDSLRKAETLNNCSLISTEFIGYEEIKNPAYPTQVKEIAIDCSNGERYFIEHSSINKELKNELALLSKNDSIFLLIHPDGKTVVDLSTESDGILKFGNASENLRRKDPSLIICFCLSAVLMFYIIHFIRLRKKQKNHN